MAGTFGTVIQDKSLQVRLNNKFNNPKQLNAIYNFWKCFFQRLGVKTELVGLIICLSFGFLFGIIYTSVSWGEGFWLKDEMVARCFLIFLNSFFSLCWLFYRFLFFIEENYDHCGLEYWSPFLQAPGSRLVYWVCLTVNNKCILMLLELSI